MCVWCTMYIHDPWSWYMYVWCIYLFSSILDSDACVNDAHIYDPGPWSWSMHVCMILDPDVCMYDAYILDPDTRGHDAHMYDAWSLIPIHGCMMHISLIFDPWPWCMYVWCIHLWSLILTHVCTIHVFMMRQICHAWTNIDPDACMHDACIHVCDPWILTLMHVCMMHIFKILDHATCMHDTCIHGVYIVYYIPLNFDFEPLLYMVHACFLFVFRFEIGGWTEDMCPLLQ